VRCLLPSHFLPELPACGGKAGCTPVWHVTCVCGMELHWSRAAGCLAVCGCLPARPFFASPCSTRQGLIHLPAQLRAARAPLPCPPHRAWAHRRRARQAPPRPGAGWHKGSEHRNQFFPPLLTARTPGREHVEGGDTRQGRPGPGAGG